MKIEEWFWGVLKELEAPGKIQMDSYEIIENATDEDYFNLVNNDPSIRMVDGKLDLDMDKVEKEVVEGYDPEEYDSYEQYVASYKAHKIYQVAEKLRPLIKYRPKLMKCKMICCDGSQITRVFALPKIEFYCPFK